MTGNGNAPRVRDAGGRGHRLALTTGNIVQGVAFAMFLGCFLLACLPVLMGASWWASAAGAVGMFLSILLGERGDALSQHRGDR